MIEFFKDVKAFHQKFEVPMPSTLGPLNNEAYNFRIRFLEEEKSEFVTSHYANNIEGCLDALLDLIYVAAGTALMMGASELQWQKAFTNRNDLRDHIYLCSSQLYTDYPTLINPVSRYNDAITNMNFHLKNFINNHYYEDYEECVVDMCALCCAAFEIALHMGVRYDALIELWKDIQRANMSKVRATDASQSKRKTSLDVVKPLGWQGPKATEILQKHYPTFKAVVQ